MAEVEWDHELYFRNKAATSAWAKWIKDLESSSATRFDALISCQGNWEQLIELICEQRGVLARRKLVL
jgi:hypothetical protein